jgi:hypothetical protein
VKRAYGTTKKLRIVGENSHVQIIERTKVWMQIRYWLIQLPKFLLKKRAIRITIKFKMTTWLLTWLTTPVSQKKSSVVNTLAETRSETTWISPLRRKNKVT